MKLISSREYKNKCITGDSWPPLANRSHLFPGSKTSESSDNVLDTSSSYTGSFSSWSLLCIILMSFTTLCVILPPTSGARRAILACVELSRKLTNPLSSCWTIGLLMALWSCASVGTKRRWPSICWITAFSKMLNCLIRRHANRCGLQHQVGFSNREGRGLQLRHMETQEAAIPLHSGHTRHGSRRGRRSTAFNWPTATTPL